MNSTDSQGYKYFVIASITTAASLGMAYKNIKNLVNFKKVLDCLLLLLQTPKKIPIIIFMTNEHWRHKFFNNFSNYLNLLNNNTY